MKHLALPGAGTNRLICGLPESTFKTSFIKQKPAERAKVVQYTTACRHVSVQFGEVEVDKLQCFSAAAGIVGAGERYVGVDLGQSFPDSLREEADVFLRTFYIVKRSFGPALAHSADLLAMRK